MKWYQTIFNKDPSADFMKKKPEKMGKNIYDSKDTKTHQKRFHLIHYVFKYKFFVPMLLLGKKMLNKHLVKKIPQANHNRNIILFDKAFEKSIEKWHLLYLRNSGDPSKRPLRKDMLKRAKNEPYLRTMKEFVNTMYIHDTAYREFMNILLHEIAHEMAVYYSTHPDKKTGHLFYTTDIYDTNYYVLEKAIQYQVQIGVADAEQLLQAREEQAKIERELRRKRK